MIYINVWHDDNFDKLYTQKSEIKCSSIEVAIEDYYNNKSSYDYKFTFALNINDLSFKVLYLEEIIAERELEDWEYAKVLKSMVEENDN